MSVWEMNPKALMILAAATLCGGPPAVSGDPSVHWYFRNGLMRIWSKEAAAFSVSFAASNNDISRSSNQNPRHPAGRL